MRERKRKYENEQRKKKCIICGSTFMCHVIWNWKHNGLFPGYIFFPSFSLWTKDTARSTASKLVFNYMGAKGDGILNIGEESTLFTNIAIPTDWNQTQMQKVGNYQLKVTAQAIQSKGFATQSEAYRMLDEEIKGGTLQEINRGSEN